MYVSISVHVPNFLPSASGQDAQRVTPCYTGCSTYVRMPTAIKGDGQVHEGVYITCLTHVDRRMSFWGGQEGKADEEGKEGKKNIS